MPRAVTFPGRTFPMTSMLPEPFGQRSQRSSRAPGDSVASIIAEDDLLSVEESTCHPGGAGGEPAGKSLSPLKASAAADENSSNAGKAPMRLDDASPALIQSPGRFGSELQPGSLTK